MDTELFTIIQEGWTVVGALAPRNKLIFQSFPYPKLTIDRTTGLWQILTRRAARQTVELCKLQLDHLFTLTDRECQALLESCALDLVSTRPRKELQALERLAYDSKKERLTKMVVLLKEKALKGLPILSETYERPDLFDSIVDKVKALVATIDAKLESCTRAEVGEQKLGDKKQKSSEIPIPLGNKFPPTIGSGDLMAKTVPSKSSTTTTTVSSSSV